MGLLDITGLGSVFEFATKIIDKVFPDKDKADAVKLEMFRLKQQGDLKEIDNDFQLQLQQLAVNLEEAKNGSTFVSGWRPACGWCCAFALAYNYILMPFIAWGAKVFYASAPAMPVLDIGELMTLLFGMLGLSASRSFDKVKSNTDNK